MLGRLRGDDAAFRRRVDIPRIRQDFLPVRDDPAAERVRGAFDAEADHKERIGVFYLKLCGRLPGLEGRVIAMDHIQHLFTFWRPDVILEEVAHHCGCDRK